MHSLLHGSTVNGPGIRSVVWTQGCSLACPGCQNPKTHDPAAGETIHPLELAHRIVMDAAPDTEGVTISGGEPLQQAVSVSILLDALKLRRPDWSFGLFTGYYPEELGPGNYGHDPEFGRYSMAIWPHSIRHRLDFAVMGRYDREQLVQFPVTPDLKLCSTANQKLVLLSQRYSYSDFDDLSVEYNIGPDGQVVFTGFPGFPGRPNPCSS